MVLIENYSLAVITLIVTMICWGSWANTQKLAAKTWRFELFYMDFVLGIFIFSIFTVFTVGSFGNDGRTFIEDLHQTDISSIVYAMIGGAIWNIGTLLLVAAIAIAGMSVGFPIGGGIAWILGIIVNFVLVYLDKGEFQGNQLFLWAGVLVIVLAIYLSMLSFKRLSTNKKTSSKKGIIIAVAAGLLIAFFYGFVVKSLDNTYVAGGTGTLTPFSGVFFFSVGAFLSTFIINPIFMKYPIHGEPVSFALYFKGNFKTHSTGILGGFIWSLGMVLSFMAAGATSPTISYALSNAAPVVAILWGIFVWKEFKGAPSGTNKILSIMFVCYMIGLVLITLSSN